MGGDFSSEDYAQLVERLSDEEKLELITLLSESLNKKKKRRGGTVAELRTSSLLSLLSKPMRDTLDLDELIREQNYLGGNQERFDRKAAKLNITEPVEVLIAQLTP